MAVERADQPSVTPSGFANGRPWERLGGATGLVGDRIAVDIYVGVEVLAIFAIGVAAAEVYVGARLGVADYFHDYLAPLLLLPLVAGSILNQRGLHAFSQLCRFPSAIGPVATSIASAFAALVVAGFVFAVANDFSRVWFVSWFGLSMVAVLGLRALAARLFTALSDLGVIQKTVAIYGFGPPAREVAAEIRRSRLGIRLAAVFEPTPGEAGEDPMAAIAEFIAFAQSRAFDTVILALPAAAASQVKPLLAELSVLPSEVQLYLGFDGGRVPLRGISAIDRLSLLDIQRKPIPDWGLVAKTVEDYAIAGIGVLLVAPLLALVALAIKLESAGPVFFVQRRHGYNNTVIRVWKFRTMKVMEDGDDFVQARRRDDRVTRVGALLRRTSLDELPQLFNVLRGEMSIVGPRPHPLALNDRYARQLNRYLNRHRVKPGITGWAQIHGYRGPTDDPVKMRKRVEYDLDYIENWSLWMDLKIIAATLFVGLIHRNAV